MNHLLLHMLVNFQVYSLHGSCYVGLIFWRSIFYWFFVGLYLFIYMTTHGFPSQTRHLYSSGSTCAYQKTSMKWNRNRAPEWRYYNIPMDIITYFYGRRHLDTKKPGVCLSHKRKDILPHTNLSFTVATSTREYLQAQYSKVDLCRSLAVTHT